MHGYFHAAHRVTWLIVVLGICGCGRETAPVADSTTVPESAPEAMDVVVYASVSAAQIAPVLEAFTAETGNGTQLVVDDFTGLARRFANHGTDPVADLLVAANLTELSAAVESDFFRPSDLTSAGLDAAAALGDPDGFWQPLGITARIVVYNAELVADDEIATIADYASLADDIWHERLCISSSRLPGNRTLIAMLIRDHGVREAELIVRAWRASLAERFFESDIDLVRAVAAGECQLAIADTRAMATIIAASPQAPLATVRFPDVATTLVDISAAGVTRHAGNPQGAAMLLQWLVSKDPNSLYSAYGYEFPVHPAAAVAVPIQSWSDRVESPMQISQLSFLQRDAELLTERARYP
jgi:iron(III) transport system substrate-binding protein